MNLRYSIQNESQQIDFHVNHESGALMIEVGAQTAIEVPHLVAVELIELLRNKLYVHEDSKSIFKRLFR